MPTNMMAFRTKRRPWIVNHEVPQGGPINGILAMTGACVPVGTVLRRRADSMDSIVCSISYPFVRRKDDHPSVPTCDQQGHRAQRRSRGGRRPSAPADACALDRREPGGTLGAERAGCHGFCAVQQKEALSIHIRWRMTANLRARATFAFLVPTFLANVAAHVFGRQPRRTRVSKTFAASKR